MWSQCQNADHQFSDKRQTLMTVFWPQYPEMHWKLRNTMAWVTIFIEILWQHDNSIYKNANILRIAWNSVSTDLCRIRIYSRWWRSISLQSEVLQSCTHSPLLHHPSSRYWHSCVPIPRSQTWTGPNQMKELPVWFSIKWILACFTVKWLQEDCKISNTVLD